jgi:putative membrane protein
VFGIACTLFCEWLSMSPAPSFAEARRIQLCDRWYGACAAVVLIVGVLRVIYFETR